MEENKERIFVTTKDNIVEFENNFVTLKLADGSIYEKVEPRRLFPVSRTDTYISLLNSQGQEVAIIREKNDLNFESLKVLNKSLDNYYLVPYISEIVSITEKSGTLLWTVITNRGEKQFEVRDRNHDIRIYKNGEIRVRDSDDNRYVIRDYKTLSKRSIKQLSSDL